MAVCARGSVLVFYVVFALFSTFWDGRAIFQGRAQMITNFFLYGLITDKTAYDIIHSKHRCLGKIHITIISNYLHIYL